jgi:pyruvate dehydrogenase E2 component (dihydrolipoamide acetyltransferase)
MNAAPPMQTRRAASPYARRLARERAVALDDLAGSGPGGRVVAADILAYRPPLAETLPAQPPVPTIIFSAALSLTDLFRLTTEAARAGFDIAIEDAAARAVRIALDGVPGGIALELDGRQIMLGTDAGLSIGAERGQRLAALASDADASAEPAAASLLVLSAARVVPVALPLLPGRAIRLVLAVDRDQEHGHALLQARPGAITEARAMAVLGAFATALEEPLALLA